MYTNKLRILMIFSVFLILCFSILPASETNTDSTGIIKIDKWLFVGPFPQKMPVFHAEKNLHKKTIKYIDLLKYEHIDISNLTPVIDEDFFWQSEITSQWTENCDTIITLNKLDNNFPEFYYLATYLDTKHWVKGELSLNSYHPFAVFLDGKNIGYKETSQEKDSVAIDKGNFTKKIVLETGKHLLLIKIMKDPDISSPIEFNGKINLTQQFAENILVSSSPERILNTEDILNLGKVKIYGISRDGKVVALKISKQNKGKSKSEKHVEFRELPGGKLVKSLQGSRDISNIKWSPTNSEYAFTTSENGTSTLQIAQFPSGESRKLLSELKNLNNYTWSPNGKFIVYTLSEEAPKKNPNINLLDGMLDRQKGFKSRSFLYMIDIKSGVRQRLTAGKLSTDFHSISPDSKQLVFSSTYEDYTERPFSKTDYYLLDFKTMMIDTLFTLKWGGGVEWSPNNKELLVLGGPTLFGTKGLNVKNKIPNDYDTQAYIFDINSKEIEPITKEFAPSIKSSYWSKSEDCIYFQVGEKSYINLYRYLLKKRRFEKIPLETEVTRNIEFSDNKEIAVYYGSGASCPPKLYSLNLRRNQSKLIYDTGQNILKNTVYGKVERWTFQNKENIEIEGRIYFPPGFDSQKKYPTIVYYYAGTSPVTRDFGGRYPKELWAAQGYLVYVLQPSGATGFGQEFSAKHVNEWGTIVIDEIIQGTKEFLDSHPYADPNKVGCIGASYGGFTTELLITHTDIFAAAVSHAGISSIASYWGEGYWGYSYGAVANATRFPWTNKDYFVRQSALFNADKINTPLLLTHGMSDTNVPPGESIQLYTALKLLGKEVEFLQVKGENHWILTYDKREKWTKSIMAYFDKWLKDEPQWWDNLYGE